MAKKLPQGVHALALLSLSSCLLPTAAQAAFAEDSQLNLSARNFYMNRDFRNNDEGNHKAAEWSQGFMLRLNSGFTEVTLRPINSCMVNSTFATTKRCSRA